LVVTGPQRGHVWQITGEGAIPFGAQSPDALMPGIPGFTGWATHWARGRRPWAARGSRTAGVPRSPCPLSADHCSGEHPALDLFCAFMHVQPLYVHHVTMAGLCGKRRMREGVLPGLAVQPDGGDFSEVA
jgi:hypothetical protein